MGMTEPEFLALGLLHFLPEHEAGLSLQHNEHRVFHQTAAEQLAEWDRNGQGPEWLNAEARERAAATDEIWLLRWYPHTPVGFEEIAAPTLNELLAFAVCRGS